MTSAYLISDVDVTDAAQYEQYMRLSTLGIQVHGAEALPANRTNPLQQQEHCT